MTAPGTPSDRAGSGARSHRGVPEAWRKRHAGRQLALRALFQMDAAQRTLEEAMGHIVARQTAGGAASFARELVATVLTHRSRIDRVLEKYARGWTLDRMANVDRNVLRVAVCELLYSPDVPPSVAVDEAVELAKKYGAAESGRFVNGILGNLVRNLEAERAEAA